MIKERSLRILDCVTDSCVFAFLQNLGNFHLVDVMHVLNMSATTRTSTVLLSQLHYSQVLASWHVGRDSFFQDLASFLVTNDSRPDTSLNLLLLNDLIAGNSQIFGKLILDSVIYVSNILNVSSGGKVVSLAWLQITMSKSLHSNI